MMVITMAKLRMAHASTHGARKPPGPKSVDSGAVKKGNGVGEKRKCFKISSESNMIYMRLRRPCQEMITFPWCE